MRKKRIRERGVLWEPLERRQLLSAAVQSVMAATAAVVQVQPVLQFHPTYHLYAPAGSLTPLQTAGAQGYTPSEIRTAYGLNQVTFGTVAGDGTGQTIAIIDAYNDPTIQSDLGAFDGAFGLANPSLRVVSQSGSTSLPGVDPAGAGNNNWEGEEALDVEWAHAIAPGASIILVEANDASPSNLFAAVNWARQQAGVSVVSMSFGGNETSTETQFDSSFTTPSGHTGVTFVASTGDSGAPAGYPAYSPNVVAVGGTSLAVDAVGNYLSETGWSGSGGGISTVEAQPAYQNGVVTQSGAFRTNPDVAFVADPSTGVSIYDSYNNGTSTPWEIIGGTSVAAPCWAGIFAVADQGRVATNEGTLDSRTGALPLLYAAPVTIFHDVTTGNNGFGARSGYDLVTGRGSPKVNLLIPYLVNGTTPPPPPPSNGPTIGSLTANVASVAEGSSIVLTANNALDTGATGLVMTFYEETNGVAGLQTDPTTGDYAFTAVTDGSNTITLDTTNATPGTYVFYAQLTDSSGGASANGTNAPSVTVTVTAPNNSGPAIASITANPNPVVSGDVMTLTANGITDPLANVRRVYFYEETNGIPGLQTGPGGDFSFRPTSVFSGFSLNLDTTGVTGALTFYAQAVDYFGNVSADGTAAPSTTVTITSDTVPNAPTGLTATASATGEIDLSYAEVDSGQTGFTIERSQDPNFATVTQLFTINRSNALSYSDTGLSADTTYYYRVQAFNPAGASNFSNVASAHTFFTAMRLVIAQHPTPTVAGAKINAVVIDLTDARGRIVTTDNSTVTIGLGAGAAGATLGGTMSVPVIQGVATFPDLVLDKSGSYTLEATDGGLTAAMSKTFTVTPDLSTAQLAWAKEPDGTVLVGTALTPAPIVESVDRFGNPITTDHSRVILSTTSGNFTGRSTVQLSGGKAAFNNIVFKTAGEYVLSATPASTSTMAIMTPITLDETIEKGSTNAIAVPGIRAGGYTFGSTMQLGTKLTSSAPGGIAFMGTPTLVINGTESIPATMLTGAGVVRFTVPTLEAGVYSGQIAYAGDVNHSGANSVAFAFTVNQATTTTALAVSGGRLVFGQALTLTATVRSRQAPGIARAGEVEFLDNGVVLQTVTLNGSSNASATVTLAATGSHSYEAIYLGDTDFQGSTSALLKRTVNKDNTAIRLTASVANPISINQTLQVNIQVSVLAPGISVLTGDLVTIKDHGTTMGTLSLTGSGAGTWMGLTYMASGTHNLTAIFAGDADTLAATSAVLKLVVN